MTDVVNENLENEIEVSVVEEVDEVTNGQEETIEESFEKNVDTSIVEKQRFVRLPLARVKNIMKSDPDCGIVSQDSVFLITKATVSLKKYINIIKCYYNEFIYFRNCFLII